MSVDELKRLEELEQENAGPKEIVAIESAEIDITKDHFQKVLTPWQEEKCLLYSWSKSVV